MTPTSSYRNAIVREAAGGGVDCLVIRNPNLEKTFVLPANIEVVQVMSNFTGNDQANKIFAGFEEVEGLVTNESGSPERRRRQRHHQRRRRERHDRWRLGGGSADGRRRSDVLIGGTGSDTLIGALGNDTFRFTSTQSSTPTASDVIEKFDRAGGGVW